jgi:hypothetical protein
MREKAGQQGNRNNFGHSNINWHSVIKGVNQDCKYSKNVPALQSGLHVNVELSG